ncbi:TPA: toxin-activating lysine-acyltransferase [Escherichia coli]|uniref:toxin-activating lysine-acyltransferase n=2 Tax=cellular organisms TaxID=131567 RepID=UPI000BE6BD8D|nr:MULTISPECIES: toxin-activating lysine-acyltransferase [Enterobacteriaceae]HAV1607790.1 toxin-activating lysine-acyltransferase [Enterobacter hormaechei subsp. steigerwaltii]EFC4527787.1 toxin-activating lysine-acyltransferase [Escherichia coli]EFC5408551.1 toxin-activating lysine-acyltransferase [Escherichia coli]EGM8440867.1 toxin-activating lysine-acyltransferase [Escherichia coli]EIJ4517479.1 toxin-activating lysine-acyltransferase [Escherichia coli]
MDRYDIDLEVVGKVAWLWGCSSLHKSWPISIFHNNVLPAIIHKQYVLLMKNDYPVAWCSWANLSLENEAKYIMDTNSLVADDWISGDRKWFIDWIAPFGHTSELYMHMREHYPHSLFRAIRVSQQTSTGKVTEFHGGKIDKTVAKKQFIQYHYELSEALKNIRGKYVD